MLSLCKAQNHCLILAAANQLMSQPRLRLEEGDFVVPLNDAISRLLAAKLAANRRSVYLKSLSHYLARFAAGRASLPTSSITAPEIEAWLEQFPSPSSRQTWLNRLSTLFSFCLRKGWLDKNPCDCIDRVSIDRKPPSILTPAQSRHSGGIRVPRTGY